MNYRTLGDITRALKNQLVGANQTQEPQVDKTPEATPIKDAGIVALKAPRKKK